MDGERKRVMLDSIAVSLSRNSRYRIGRRQCSLGDTGLDADAVLLHGEGDVGITVRARACNSINYFHACGSTVPTLRASCIIILSTWRGWVKSLEAPASAVA